MTLGLKGLKVRTMIMVLYESRFETLGVKGLKVRTIIVVLLYDSRFET